MKIDMVSPKDAEELRCCIDHLYKALVNIGNASMRAGRDMEVFTFPIEYVAVFDSAFVFLVGRNKDVFLDRELLDVGSRVELTFIKARKYYQDPNADLVRVRVDALIVFEALLIKLFLSEVERGMVPFCDRGNGVLRDDLQRFASSVTNDLLTRVRSTPPEDIVAVRYHIAFEAPLSVH